MALRSTEQFGSEPIRVPASVDLPTAGTTDSNPRGPITVSYQGEVIPGQFASSEAQTAAAITRSNTILGKSLRRRVNEVLKTASALYRKLQGKHTGTHRRSVLRPA